MKGPQNSTPFLPVLSLLLGAALWGLIWFPMRLLETRGLNGLWLTFILYSAALLVSLPRLVPCLRDFRHAPRLMGLLLLSGGWTNIAFVLAILRGNVLRVLLLFYLSPLWATLLGWAFLKEKITGASLFHLFLVMSGALLMLWDPGIGFPWPRSIEDWLALSSGLAFAVANAVVRKMDDISLSTKSVGVFIGVCMVSALILTVRHLPFPTVSQETILGAAALGILGVLGMTVLVQYGVTHLPIHRSSVILLFELIVGAISQQVLTNEVVMPWEWAGGILIMVGAYGASRPSETKRNIKTPVNYRE